MWVLGVFALFVLLLLPPTYHVAKIAQQVRRDISTDADDLTDDIPREQLARLLPMLESRLSEKLRTPRHLASYARQVWQRLSCRAPRLGISTVLLAAYLSSCTVGVGAVFVFEFEFGARDLYSAIDEDDVARVNSLLELGVDPNYPSLAAPPLVVAARRGRPDVVDALLGAGADANATDFDGRTALMVSSANAHRAVAELLLAEGAGVNAQAVDGRTALMAAALNGHAEIVELLLDNGADPDPRDKDGLTALMLARASGHEEVVDLLK